MERPPTSAPQDGWEEPRERRRLTSAYARRALLLATRAGGSFAAALLGLLFLGWRVPVLGSRILRAMDPLVLKVLRLGYPVTPPAPEPSEAAARIELDLARVQTILDERFLSVAVDVSEVVGGHWWSPSGQVEFGRDRHASDPFNFASARLRRLARELAPAYLRIGGTEADVIYYGLEEDLAPPPTPYEHTLTARQWNGVVDFAREVGMGLFFTVNAGPSSRSWSGRWSSSNVERLFSYMRAHGQRVDALELGNEVNAYWLMYDPWQQPKISTYAEDLALFRRVAREAFPEALIVGPAEAFWPVLGPRLGVGSELLGGLLERGAGSTLDAISWHYYPQQSRRCPVATRRASPSTLLNPAYLDEAAQFTAQLERERDAFAPSTALWLGETGNAQCGGEPGTSDRFASSLAWVDLLGLMASHDQRIVVRQTLAGSDYGLLDPRTFAPRPDYFASVLFKRLMGERVLAPTRRGDAFVRVYAHCAGRRAGARHGAITLLAVNLHPNHHATLAWPGGSGRSAWLYELTAASLESPVVRLNGRKLEDDGAGVFSLEGRPIELSNAMTLAPLSVTFVVADVDAPACATP